jgi:NTE family protein
VGIAFGGGSARGLAHVGVIRWFEEHRIPIDLAAGTSMGALVGGAFASGMNADELDELLASINWDDLFGSSDFAFRNIRRKADARAYPSRLEFGLKRGIVPPPSLNSGEQVDLLLARITAPYYDLERFDDLPTPFRAVAFDLASASQVVLDRGSLARAMRASMSLPLIFPPWKSMDDFWSTAAR